MIQTTITYIFTYIPYIFAANFIFVLLEFFYSFYKKDQIYSVPGTLNNLLGGVVLQILSPRFYKFYFILFLMVSGYLKEYLQFQFSWPSFLICLLLVDFAYYIFHRLHHLYAPLWALHFVHHSDNKLNLSTAMRISWFEQLYIFIFFLPIVFLGFDPIIIFLAFYLLSEYQFFCHSQYFRLPKFFDYVLVTPNNHRIHHDQLRQHQSNNYGGVFIVWDRLLGTYVADIKSFNPGVVGYREDVFYKYQFDGILKWLHKSVSKK